MDNMLFKFLLETCVGANVTRVDIQSSEKFKRKILVGRRADSKYLLELLADMPLSEEQLRRIQDTLNKELRVTRELARVQQCLTTQDNRMTANPVFLVQVCERIGPMTLDYFDTRYFYNQEENESYYPDRPDPEEWKRLRKISDECNLPEHIHEAAYREIWKTVCVCFTEEGCKNHLKENEHNYGAYHGVRIYVDSLYRNTEMQVIREALIEGRFK